MVHAEDAARVDPAGADLLRSRAGRPVTADS